MKKTTPLWLCALLTALPGLLDCGSDTEPSTGAPATTTGGSGGATGSGSSTGTNSTSSSTTGSSTGTTDTTGATSTGATTTSATTGAGGDMTTTAGSGGGTTSTGMTTGAGGSTGTGGAGTGGAGGARVDAGACPRTQPNQGAACTSMGEVCDYTGFACTCEAVGMTRDGGMRDGWNCVRVRADAGTVDASTCPRVAPANGTICTSVGEVCPYGRETCTCQMGMGGGMRDRWACTVGGRDAGGGG
jgi:hypothetical protein